MSSLNSAVMMLDMSLMAAKAVLAEGNAPLHQRLSWLSHELERLAIEAERLADESEDAPEFIAGWDGPLPGFDGSPNCDEENSPD